MVKQLMKNDPRFVVVGSSGGNSIDLKRLDTNQLLAQIGVVEGLRSEGRPAGVESQEIK
jgi:hypothetical protein